MPSRGLIDLIKINLRSTKLLVRHTKIKSTIESLGIKIEGVLTIFDHYEIKYLLKF